MTDGFTGNITLKLIEGCTEAALSTGIRQEVKAESATLAGRFKPAMARVWKRYDHEEYGGALLLGVSGAFLKVHGSAGNGAVFAICGGGGEEGFGFRYQSKDY